MRFFSEGLALSDEVFMILRDLIHERIGMYFDAGKNDILSDKLSPLVIDKGLTSFIDYFYFLKYEEGSREEWDRVSDALSVPESFFWREVDQIKALTDVVVPEFFRVHWDRPLTIWSAASARGEEALTIAMMLNEAGWFERGKIDIYASDGSSQAIAAARSGIYRERSLRNLSAPLREKYFTSENGMFRIRPDIHRRIQWRVANLMAEQEVRTMAASAVIFCRNVFIYFSEASIRKTVHLFAERMTAPAYLFVGAAESLLRSTSQFDLQELNGALVYVRKGETS